MHVSTHIPTPPAGSVSLLALAMGNINLTSPAWTLYDPDSLVKSVSYSAGYNVVTWNTLGVGSTNYQWTTSTTMRAPRWYRTFEIDGTRLTSDDLIMLQSMIQIDTSVDDFSQEIVVGACELPTSLTSTTLLGAGGVAKKTLAGNDVYGVWTNNTATTAGNAGAVRGFSSLIYGLRSIYSGACAVLDASDTRNNSTSRNGNINLSSSLDLYFMVGVGTNGAVTVAEDDQQKFRIDILPLSITPPA